jgi:hypothetical protein
MYKDFNINIQVDNTLVVVSSFGQGSLIDDKQLYLLENVIRPAVVELS